MNTYVRWMIRRELPRVLEIEAASFVEGWTEADFLRILSRYDNVGMVAEQGQLVVGFMIYRLYRHRIELLNFAVHPNHRRQGVGMALATKLVNKLAPRRRERVTLCVRETNLAAQLFFRAAGFSATGVLRDCYDDTGEDGYQMRYLLPLICEVPSC